MKLTCPNCGVQGNLDVQNTDDRCTYLTCPVCYGRFNVKIRKDRNNVLVMQDPDPKSCEAGSRKMPGDARGGPFLWLLGIHNKHKSLPVAATKALQCRVRSA